MSKKMYANFSDDAYNDLMSGAAVDNNGLRSPKGSFYPDQPSFEPINEQKEQIKDAAIQLGIEFCRSFAFEIVLPFFKWVTQEKVYPLVAEKWDSLQDKRQGKKSAKQITQKEYENPLEDTVNNVETSSNCRIINLDGYRKIS